MGTWPPTGQDRWKMGEKWPGKISGREARERKNPGRPSFCALLWPRFRAAILLSSFFRITTTCSYSTPPFFLWTGQQTWTKEQKKNCCDEIWERSARERRARYSPPDFVAAILLSSLFFAPRRTKRNRDSFFLRIGQQHVCTCLNISFLLNLLATGSWHTALGQELILSKMSFSLSSDTGNKLKTKKKQCDLRATS